MQQPRRFLSELGKGFAAANTDERVLARPASGRLALTLVLAHAPMGVVSPTVTLKDCAQMVGMWSLPVGDSKTLLNSPAGLPLTGDLVAQVSATGVTVSAWGMEVDA
jgi:hypothetical protein